MTFAASALERPRQNRTRETTERILTAVEKLLRQKAFETITIAEISRAAGVTSGAIYARFPSKDAILPEIYRRYDQWAESIADQDFGAVDWADQGLDEAIKKIVSIFINRYSENAWLCRAVALFARARPELLPVKAGERRSKFISGAVRALEPHKDAIGPEWEKRVVFSTYAIATVAREAIVFSDSPMASIANFERAKLAEDLFVLMKNYLAGPPKETENA